MGRHSGTADLSAASPFEAPAKAETTNDGVCGFPPPQPSPAEAKRSFAGSGRGSAAAQASIRFVPRKHSTRLEPASCLWPLRSTRVQCQRWAARCRIRSQKAERLRCAATRRSHPFARHEANHRQRFSSRVPWSATATSLPSRYARTRQVGLLSPNPRCAPTKRQAALVGRENTRRTASRMIDLSHGSAASVNGCSQNRWSSNGDRFTLRE